MTEITKTCRLCGDAKPIEEFPLRNKTSRRHDCKICHNKKFNKGQKNYKKKYRLLNKIFVYTYLTTHPCVDCGESDPVCLEFDHVRGVKRDDICRMINDRFSIEIIKQEIEKCEVRCANCHMKKTAKDFDWYKLQFTSQVVESETRLHP